MSTEELEQKCKDLEQECSNLKKEAGVLKGKLSKIRGMVVINEGKEISGNSATRTLSLIKGIIDKE